MLALLRIIHIKILKSPALWISLVFVGFFLAFSPKAIGSSAMPGEENSLSIQIASAIIITGLLMTVMTSFGESFVKIKGSLLFQNIELNNKPKYQFYVATITPVVVYSLAMLITSMAMLAIFDSLGLIGATSNIIKWNEIQYLYLLISIISTVFLGITVALLFSSLSKTDNTYTALVWAYLFLVFFFGGSSVPIFLIRGEDPLAAFTYLSMCIPNTFSNFLFVNSMDGNITFSTNIEVVNILDIILPFVLGSSFIGIRQIILIRKR